MIRFKSSLRFIITCLLCSYSLITWAQTAEEPERKWRVRSTFVSGGVVLGEGDAAYNINTFSSYLKTPITIPSGYNDDCTPYCYLFDSKYPMVLNFGASIRRGLKSAGLDKKEANVNKPEGELRIGASFNINSKVIGYQQESPMHGAIYPYIAGDSLNFSALAYRLWQVDFSLNAAYLFSTRSFGRFSFYAGVELGLGTPIISRIDRSLTNGISVVSDKEPSGRRIYDSQEDFTSTNTRGMLLVRVRLPLGMRVRLNERLQVFAEAPFGFSFLQVFGSSNYTKPYFVPTLGVRMTY